MSAAPLQRQPAACHRWRWLALGLLLLASGCGAAATGPAQSPERRAPSAAELTARGEAAAQAGDTTRAEQYFAAALHAGGDPAPTVRRLIATCVADRRYPAAAQYADRYLLHHPDDAGILLAAASLHLAAGNAERARELLQELVTDKPRWPEPHFALATALRYQGEATAEAELHDLQYLKLAPRGPLAELARARLRRAPRAIEAEPSEGQPAASEPPAGEPPTSTLPATPSPTNALPSNALPSNALPSNALPTNALPSNALPTNATRSNTLPSNLPAEEPAAEAKD